MFSQDFVIFFLLIFGVWVKYWNSEKEIGYKRVHFVCATSVVASLLRVSISSVKWEECGKSGLLSAGAFLPGAPTETAFSPVLSLGALNRSERLPVLLFNLCTASLRFAL